MAREHAVFSEENFPIPAGAFTFEGFRRWVESDEFPESGRIDFLAGDVEVDLSPEELFTHNLVKMAIGSGLNVLIADRDLGEVFADKARVTSPQAGLSVEPDVVVVLEESFREGRVRYPPSDRSADRFLEIEGAPDLVVEVVSDSSVHKDTRRLPKLYARAGVPELWIADARGSQLQLRAYTLREGGYVLVDSDAEGWFRSPRLGLAFRLTRRRSSMSTWRYSLEHKDA